MQKIQIKNHYLLKDQEIELNSSLNIITSINGGGKTAFVNEVKKHYKRAIFLNREFIDNFFTSKYLNEYVGKLQKNTYETVIYKYISEFYERLNSGENFIEEFEEFAQQLNLSIIIDKDAINGGVLMFANNRANKIAFNEISNSEKTAFILWLATKCESDILILDNIDAVFYDYNMFYSLLSRASSNKYIISTSNRNIFGFEECIFDIQDGIITKQVGLKN
jgi:hypothetical protein